MKLKKKKQTVTSLQDQRQFPSVVSVFKAKCLIIHRITKLFLDSNVTFCVIN